MSSARDKRSYNAITVEEEPVQPVSHETRDEEENPDVQGTLGSIMMFLMRQSYIAALIIMMAWSITYHSWLTFVLLLWACLIWITPFARWFCMVSSPGLVLYAQFLLLVQFVYGLRLDDAELPIQDSTGTFDYAELGLKKWKYPCLHLGAQTLFTWVFWLTLRQHIREKKIKKLVRNTTQSGIPLTSLAHPFVQALRKMSSLDPPTSSSAPDDVDGMDARASDDAKALMMWVKSVLAKYWILLCCGAFLLVGLQNEVSVYQIGYMAIFLFILICYQISIVTWRIVLRPLWWVMVIYSICILLLIYTYQFDNMPVYWHNATGLSDQWLYNLGLRQHTKASLLMELLTPTAFSIIIVIQLHFFHRPFMAMIDIRNARCETNSNTVSRYQSVPGNNENDQEDAATNFTNLDGAENSTPEERPIRTEEQSAPSAHDNQQKSVMVSCLINFVQLYNEVTVLLWRLGELHMAKLVNFILICVVVYQVCAVNAIIIILLGISMPSRMLQRALSYCFLIWSSLVVLSKMIYQLRFVQADLFQHNCTDKSLPMPANISHFTNNALWVGFYKTDVISEDIKGYLFIVITIVLQAVIKHHQKVFRIRRGLTDPEPGILFPTASRQKADANMIECLKYLINKFFFHFGWEMSLLCVVYNMALRCDVTSVIYAIWLGVFLTLGRKNCAVVWPIYVGFLAFLLPLQYLLCLGWPPGLCLAYPWTRVLDPNLNHWLYLTDVTYPPDPKLLIGDFLQLLFACCQENVFSLERYSWSSEEPTQPSDNTRRSSRNKIITPDFMWNITWLDFTKLILFQHLYWITLAVVYITVQSTISIFNIGFILWCFFFLWHGQALYLQPRKKLLRLWKTFICYNYVILLAKVCLQAVSCVWMNSVQDFTGCWPLQLLSMFCLRESGYQNKKAVTGADGECVAPDDTGLAMDCACITFLLIQYRIFSSYYFRHVVRDHREQSEMAYRGAELVNQHLRKQLDFKLMEDKHKMDRIKRSVNKLVEKLSKLHPAGVEYEPKSHYEAIYSGDYYWFESDSESDSEAGDTPSVSPTHDRKESSSSDDDGEKEPTSQGAEAGPSTSGRPASRTGRESAGSISSSSEFVTVPTPEPSTAIVEPEGLVNKVKRWLSWIYYYIAMVVDNVIKVLREISKDYRSIADKLKRERKEKRIDKLRRSRQSHLYPKAPHTDASGESDPNESKTHISRATDEEYDSWSMVDLEETDAPNWKHSQMRVARFTVAFVYALLAHTDIICYMLMILNHMVYACLLSMPLPFLVFMWGMLSIPRPTKRFWIAVITYTQVVIVIKYLFKFPFIEFNTCNGTDGGDKDDPLCYPRILGIERVTHTSAYDLLLLLALYFHRYSLKVHGLWRDKGVGEDDTDDAAPVSPMSPNDEERVDFERYPSRASTMDTAGSQEHDGGETLWNKIIKSIKAFLHRIYDPETGSGAVDVYAMMFACQFIIFIIILFSWSAFSSPEPQRQAQFVKIVEENVVPKTFLYMLLTQFFLIIIDRCFYLRKYVFAKLFYLLFLVVGFHIFMFIIVPYVTRNPFYKNIPAIFMYIFMCMYFGLSAYQIRCGYPTRILGNFLTKSYSLTSGVLFQGFQAIPFLLELRSVLDWACTDTTLGLYHWLKMDDIYANIYVLKCYRESEKTWFQARGQKYWILSKCTLGGLLIVLLVVIIWFPLLLMSYINSVYTSNPPQDATFTLSIGGYQPLFRVSAQEQFLQQLNDSQIEKIKQRSPGTGYEKQQIDTFLRDYRERGTVELVKITGNSSSIWQISPPSRQLMMHDLLGDKNVTMRFKYEFTREPKTALVQETISGQTMIPLNSTVRKKFAAMLNNSYDGQEIEIPHIFPSFVNVPGSGSATPITALFNASYVTCGIRMRSGSSDRSVEWWELTQKSPKPIFEESVLEMITFNDLVPPLHFSFFASTGIIGLYVGFVWLVGKFVRLFFTSISYRIMFDEMPNVDKVLKLCLDIFMVRESKSFDLEEDLFAKLMFLYRSPETLIKWTKYKRH